MIFPTSSVERPTLFRHRELVLRTTVKSCIKAAAYVQFFNFWCGFYAKSWVCKTRKSCLAHVKWKWNLTLRLFQTYFKCKQTFGMRKAVGFSSTSTTCRFLRAAASIRVRLMCNLSSEKVRFLFECGFKYTCRSTRLYGAVKPADHLLLATDFSCTESLPFKLHCVRRPPT